MYDIIIIGGGPAGLSAALYAGRYNHSSMVISGLPGQGSATSAWLVENYPGYEKTSGPYLLNQMVKQAKAAGAEIIQEEATSITHNQNFDVKTPTQNFQGKTLIFATGTKHRHLDLPNEESLIGKGISYCATCDGPLYKDKIVAIAGGGDASIKAALLLDKFAKTLYLITREKELQGEPGNLKELSGTKTIVIYETTIKELVVQDGHLGSIKLSKPYQNSDTINLDGLFVEIGGIPSTGLIDSLNPQKDECGFLVVNNEMATNIPDLFAAGDVTNYSADFKQIIIASASGALAAYGAHNFLRNSK